ncbi:MAG: glucokinase [Rhizobiaceae bacterium]
MEASASELGRLPYPILIADIGGTNARFAILKDSMSDPAEFPTAGTAGFSSLEEAIQNVVLDKTSVHPRSAILAVAGPVSSDEIELTNHGWHFLAPDLLNRLRLEELVVINDFEAQALAVTALQPEDMEQIGGGDGENGAARAVLGPGTGLGVAGLVRVKGVWVPVAGEGGHVDIGPRTDREAAILAQLAPAGTRISAEEVLSGRGLANLYAAVAKADGALAARITPAEVSAGALSGSDSVAKEALSVFVTLLGRLAGDMALIFMASGGVFLTGGIAAKILPALRTGALREAFENKDPHSQFLAQIPIKVVTHPTAALVGLAAFAREPGNFGIQTGRRRWRAGMDNR